MSDRPQNLPEMPPEMPDDDGDLDETRAYSATRGMTPTYQQPSTPTPPQVRRVRPPRPAQQAVPQPQPRTGKRGSARARRDSGLYLPLWSIALMLFVVIAIAGVLALLAFSLGGNTPEQKAPIVIVSSPIPTERPASFPAVPSSPTIPPDVDPGLGGDAGIIQGPLSLSGPTLVPVEISPTPKPLTVGDQVTVIDVGADKLNIRDVAGVTGSEVVFRADEGTLFTVIGGPVQADGLTWWQVQDPTAPSLSGWAASNYLLYAPDS